MDIKQIRKLLQEHTAVVLVEEGHPPLVVKILKPPEEPEEVPISARWPKSRPPVSDTASQDSVLERLNKEILALKEQIAQEETHS
jgi:hypothetical protein